VINTVGLSVALGIGLLIGVERERRKAAEQAAGSPGLRTFALAALIGSLAESLGGGLLLVAALLVLGGIAMRSALRPVTGAAHSTTAAALLVTGLLGALAMHDAPAAAGLAVAVTLLLAERESLHRFVSQVLTPEEVRDGLLLLAAALIVRPLAPDRTVDPLQVLNLRSVWTFAVVMMAVNAAGYVALRSFGARYGLPLAGFFSGFVSSTSATLAMAERARTTPDMTSRAVAGAALASVASTVQVGVIVEALAPSLLASIMPALAAAVVTGAIHALFCIRPVEGETSPHVAAGRPFSLRLALLFTALTAALMEFAALLQHYLGQAGTLISASIAGLADAHAATASVGTLISSGKIDASTGAVAVWAGYTCNWIVKAVLAFMRERRFGWRLLPGLLLMPATGWVALFVLPR
jgi:uncharacterized membrane protein (DUF4010 family)